MSKRRLPAAFLKRGVSPSSWSPLSLAGLSVWYRADSGTFQDPSGTVPASAGDLVGAWLDRSGSAATLSQADASKRPTRQDSGPGGMPAVVFDGTDDWLRASLSRTSAESVYAVGRFASSANQTLLDATDGNRRRLYSDVGSGSLPPSYYTPGGSIFPTSGVSVGDWFACLVQCDGAASSLRVGGVNASGALGPSGDDLVVGTYGEPSYGVTMLEGAVAELLIVSGRVLDSAEVDALAGYTQARYGLTL